MLVMAGEMHLAVLADDAARCVDQDGGVVAVDRPVGLGELGIAEAEADAEPRRLVEQGALSAAPASRARKASISAWSSMNQRGKKVVRASSGRRRGRSPWLSPGAAARATCPRSLYDCHFSRWTKLRGSHGQYPAHPESPWRIYATPTRGSAGKLSCHSSITARSPVGRSVPQGGLARRAKKCDPAAHRGQGNLAAMSIIAWNFSSVGLRGVG